MARHGWVVSYPNDAEVFIRSLSTADRTAWEQLWRGYLRFYRAHLEPAVTEMTWRRLLHPDEQPHGLVAEHGGKLLGLVHYLFHRSSWVIGDSCYLQELYVAPEARGLGAGRKLIEAVYKNADAAGAERVYWHTQEFNADARALYDTLARRTSFILYRRRRPDGVC